MQPTIFTKTTLCAIILALMIFLASCASSGTSTPPSSTTLDDVTTAVRTAVTTAYPDHQLSTTSTAASGEDNARITLTGFTNAASATPLNVEFTFTAPAGFTITPTTISTGDVAFIIATNAIIPLTLTSSNDPTATSTIDVHIPIAGAPINEWLTEATLSNYLAVDFNGQTAALALTNNEITITGLTNTEPGADGSITVANTPAGFTVLPTDPIVLPDPEGFAAATITPTPNSLTFTDTINAANTQEFTFADIATEGESDPLLLLTATIQTATATTYPNTIITPTAASNEDNARITLTGFTNVASGPPLNIFLFLTGTTGFTVTPSFIRISELEHIIATNDIIPLMVTHDDTAVTTPIDVHVRIAGAPIDAWLTSDKLSEYVTVDFNDQSPTLTLSAANVITLAGLTNLYFATNGSLTLTPPKGFTVDPSVPIPLHAPAGVAAATITPTPNSLTLTDTINAANTQEFTFADITTVADRSPLTLLTTAIQTAADAVYPDATLSVIPTAFDSNSGTRARITLTGFTNVASGTPLNVDIPFTAPAGFTVSFTNISTLGAVARIIAINAITPITLTHDTTSALTTIDIDIAIAGAPINEWLTEATLSNYLAVDFNDQSPTLTLSEANVITLVDLTNVDSGTNGTITVTPPAGFTVTPSTSIVLPDPAGFIAVTTPVPASFTLTDTVNAENTQAFSFADITFRLGRGPALQITSSNIAITTGTTDGTTANSYILDPSGSTVTLSTACEVFAGTLTFLINGAPAPAATYQLSAPRVYYDRNQLHTDTGESIAANGQVNVPQTIIISDAEGTEVIAPVSFTMIFPPCLLADLEGTGTEGAPYQLSSAPHLEALSYLANTAMPDPDGEVYTGVHFALTADIDLGEANMPWSEAYNTANANTRHGFTPIAFARDLSPSTSDYYFPRKNRNFAGTLDCQNKVISNLYININHVGIGLFGAIDGTIRNCGVEDVFIIGDLYVGGLVGYNNGTISHSYVTGGNITANYLVGGLAGGSFSARIDNSHVGARTIVTGNANIPTNTNIPIPGGYTGGLVGTNAGEITSAYSDATVSGQIYTGGLVGFNNSKISNSFAAGAVTSTGIAGGLAGRNDGMIAASYASGGVSGSATDAVGGLVGFNNGSITDAYSTGNIELINPEGLASGIGGAIGNHLSGRTITNTYTTGDITISVRGFINTNIGGFIGLSEGTITASYWDSGITVALTASGTARTWTPQGVGSDATATGIDARSTSDLQAAAPTATTYVSWDATNIWEFTSGAYPRLRAVPCVARQHSAEPLNISC